MQQHPIAPWKRTPFLRLLVPVVIGILLQWNITFEFKSLLFSLILALCFSLCLYFFSLARKFQVHAFRGLLVNLVLVIVAMLLTWQKDIRHRDTWFGNRYRDSAYLVVRINEALVEKPKSYKAEAVVEAVIADRKVVNCTGKILLYFSKDSLPLRINYGDVILISKPSQRIKNSGNPGAFNYERYAGFQQIFHNVFLKQGNWKSMKINHANPIGEFLISTRKKILDILQTKIEGKDEQGIAQALLIGYTNDLDKDLVQAYSNTGVVHIIAISGMHLGLIYVLLVWIFKRLPLVRRSKALQVLLILACLWTFSLLTGASASVVRAAVMFTFICIGSAVDKKSSIYNSLAASAFVMLCYNPFFLWDVGFQLSYLAVVGIIVFQKPIYNWFYFSTKLLDGAWKLAAISLAAQVLTFPVCIFYFHQFPNLFLLTNLFAVPLSSLILYGEIALVCLASVPFLGDLIGKSVALLLSVMNGTITWFNKFPFAVWDGIPSSPVSTGLLYFVVIAISTWLMTKHKGALKIALASLVGFNVLHSQFAWDSLEQQKIIIYNVPQHSAMDLISGRNYRFVGDTILLQKGMLQNFHLKPARVAMQLSQPVELQPSKGSFIQFRQVRLLQLAKPRRFKKQRTKIDLDVIVLSRGSNARIKDLADIFNCRQYVFDASNSLWKIGKWQKECEELHLRSYSVPEMGAFVLDVKQDQ
ncbi:MAG: ComEC/Rec2 family competence protein [Ferruginibacter sp.]|nr:ComEC/Rec2 family competence protein [Ferruginibacter sp.]